MSDPATTVTLVPRAQEITTSAMIRKQASHVKWIYKSGISGKDVCTSNDRQKINQENHPPWCSLIRFLSNASRIGTLHSRALLDYHVVASDQAISPPVHAFPPTSGTGEAGLPHLFVPGMRVSALTFRAVTSLLPLPAKASKHRSIAVSALWRLLQLLL